MNYYEELGVRHDASIEEIRQAYKMLARLLHPDRQVDPDLKQIADRQMKRLGEISALLTDPRTRSHYDELLLLRNHVPASYRGRGRALTVPASLRRRYDGNGMAGFAVRYWFWILMGASAMVLSTWSFMQPKPTVPVHELQGEASKCDAVSERRPMARSAKPRANPGIARNLPARPATRIPAAEKSWTPVLTLPERHYDPVLEDIPPVLSPAPELSAELGQSPLTPSLPPLRSESSFAGRWLYSPKAGDAAERGVYPATYVELHLEERGGEMAGDYRALYRVHDQAVSPEVFFQIRGAAESETSAKFVWVATNHARGRAEMTLRGPNVLYVSWWTTAFGRQATLGSGTAILIRQQAP